MSLGKVSIKEHFFYGIFHKVGGGLPVFHNIIYCFKSFGNHVSKKCVLCITGGGVKTLWKIPWKKCYLCEEEVTMGLEENINWEREHSDLVIEYDPMNPLVMDTIQREEVTWRMEVHRLAKNTDSIYPRMGLGLAWHGGHGGFHSPGGVTPWWSRTGWMASQSTRRRWALRMTRRLQKIFGRLQSYLVGRRRWNMGVVDWMARMVNQFQSGSLLG